MIEASSADAAQPALCQQWSLVSPKRVNLGFSFWAAQQGRSAKYSSFDLIFLSVSHLLVCTLMELLARV